MICGRIFAAELLQARQLHEYKIAGLLGHNIQAVTGTYARSTPEASEEAVNNSHTINVIIAGSRQSKLRLACTHGIELMNKGFFHLGKSSIYPMASDFISIFQPFRERFVFPNSHLFVRQ